MSLFFYNHLHDYKQDTCNLWDNDISLFYSKPLNDAFQFCLRIYRILWDADT